MEDSETSRFQENDSFTTKLPTKQSILLEKVIQEFIPKYTPGAKILYTAGMDAQAVYRDERSLLDLGITVEARERLPNILVHHSEKHWLVLIEAATGNGPIDEKRKDELKRLFQSTRLGLVFITAFWGYADLEKYFEAVAWETIIWLADEPEHFMLLDGNSFSVHMQTD